jgi:hypothetical protein
MTKKSTSVKSNDEGNFKNSWFEIIVNPNTRGNQALVKLGKVLTLKKNYALNKLTVKLAESDDCKTHQKTKDQVVKNEADKRKDEYRKSIEKLKDASGSPMSEKDKEELIQKHMETVVKEINMFSFKELDDLMEGTVNIDYQKVPISLSDIKVYELPENPSIETIKLYESININERDMFFLKDFIEFTE